MTEDQVRQLCTKYPTLGKVRNRLAALENQCWGDCSLPAQACDDCQIAKERGVLEYVQNMMRTGKTLRED